MGNATSSKRSHEEQLDAHGQSLDTSSMNPNFVFPDHFPPDEVVNPKLPTSGAEKHVPAVVRWKGNILLNTCSPINDY